MTHPRKIIRDSVRDAIKAASTAAADRVWSGQQPPVDVQQTLVDEGPVVLVYTRRDRSRDEDYSQSGQGWVKRVCELYVEILAAGTFVVEDKLDVIGESVEILLDSFAVPGMPSAELRLAETNVEIAEQFEQPVGGAFLLYDVTYWREWRPEEEETFFPNRVSAAIRGDAGEVVADCDTCEECPPGGRP